MLKHGSQIGLQALQLANTTLTLQGTRSLAGIEPHANQAAAGNACAIGSHIGRTVNDRRGQCGSQIIDHVIAAEQCLDDRTVARTHGQAIDQTGTGGALGGGRAAHSARHQQRLARGLLLVQGSATGALKCGSAIEQQGIDIAGEQLLNQALKLTRGLDHVTQTARDIVAQRTHQTAYERRAVGHAGIELLLAREFRAHLGQLVACLALAGTQVLEGNACRLGGLARIPLGLTSRLKGALKLLSTVATAIKRCRDLLELLIDLLQARGIHVVLDLGIGKRILYLGELERSIIGNALHIALLARKLRNLIVERHATLVKLGGGRTSSVDVLLGLHMRAGHFLELGACVLELLDHATALMLGSRDLTAHVGQARHHVMALFLEQTHIGVNATDHILHMAALLTQVAHKQALFFEHDLELLELALFLTQAVLRELQLGGALLRAALQVVPLRLQRTQLVDGQHLRKLVRARGQLFVLARAIDLALQRSQLTGDFLVDVAGTRQVLVHRLDLFERTLLATLVLGDAGGLLNEGAAFLGAALQNGIELALADDGMRILAQSRIVQDVLDVHQAARARVDEVLALARAIHAAGDSHLVKVDGKHMVRVVEHQRDLGHTHRFTRRRARKDDIFHGLAAQLLGALLTQDPQNRVGYVRFSRAVGTDDDGQARLKRHMGAVGKRLKPFEREGLEIHGSSLKQASCSESRRWWCSPCGRAPRARQLPLLPSWRNRCRGPGGYRR